MLEKYFHGRRGHENLLCHADGLEREGVFAHCHAGDGHPCPDDRKICCLLRELPAGRKARVTVLPHDDAQRARLCAMGLTPGVEVEKFGDEFGICRFQVRGCSLALDCDMAGGIICECE